MNLRSDIVMTWEEWQASRPKKRALLEKLGLDKPSRRVSAFGSQESRLRKAFDGLRIPTFN